MYSTISSWFKNNVDDAGLDAKLPKNIKLTITPSQLKMYEITTNIGDKNNTTLKKYHSKEILVDDAHEKGDVLKQISPTSGLKKNNKYQKTRTQSIVQLNTYETEKDEYSEIDENSECIDILLPFQSLGHRSSLTNVHSILEQSVPQQVPFTHKHNRSLKNENQDKIIIEQLREINNGIKNMQDFIKDFSYHEKSFKEDIDYILENICTSIVRTGRE